MIESEKARFYQMIAGVMASYAKPLPEKAILAAWWVNLESFSFEAVEAAMRAYCDENGEFAPAPVGIAKRCRLMDGRPGGEEAFALALSTIDEQNTVVWTQECAEAFAKAKPVLDATGATSARKTFIEIYDRLVAASRQQRHPVQWFASPGLDKLGYEAAVKQAVKAGLLLASPAPVLQLECSAASETFSLKPREQIEFLRKRLIEAIEEKQRAADAEIDARNEARDQVESAISADIQRKVDLHVSGNAP